MVPGNPCAPQSTSTRQIIALPSATWGSNGWRPPRSFCCFVGELWRCSACRLCTRCLCFVRRRHAERSEEHTSELQSRPHLVCRLLLEKKKKNIQIHKK